MADPSWGKVEQEWAKSTILFNKHVAVTEIPGNATKTVKKSPMRNGLCKLVKSGNAFLN